MESILSQRLSMGVRQAVATPSSSSSPVQSGHLSPSQDTADWLEPSEEFPILFGLLTAHANAQQKSKAKEKQQIRRRILLNSRMPPSANASMPEPDSSFPDPEENSDSENSRATFRGESNSSSNSNSSSSSVSSISQNTSPLSERAPASGPRSIMESLFRRNKLIRQRREEYDDDDTIPTSTTNDFDLIDVKSSESEGEGDLITENENSRRNVYQSPRISDTAAAVAPPRKRSRLEECLSYRRQSSPPTPRNRLQEGSITTNSESVSTPTLNLRDLLDAQAHHGSLPKSSRPHMDLWKHNQFRFPKRKYTRRCRDPRTNDLIVDEGDRPFQCTYCELKFKRSYHLTRHLTIHWREERFFCPGCKNACFQRKDNLLAHMRKCCPPGPGSQESTDARANLQNLPTPPRPSKTNNKINPPQDSPTSSTYNYNSNSWMCLSKFMESASSSEAHQDLEEEEDIHENVDPEIGIDLEMVEISEVSPTEDESPVFDESLDFSMKIGKPKKSQNRNRISLPPLPLSLSSEVRPKDTDMDNNNLGFNLTLSCKEKNEDKEEIYSCGDCNAVFRDLNRLMKHSTTVHVNQPSSLS